MSRTLRELGEDGMLGLLAPLLHRHTQGLPLGTGDDVAVTDAPSCGGRLVWTIDAMVEGTHFRFWEGLEGAEWLGRKLAASNLSDLASKGAAPLVALLSFGAPGDAPEELIAGFYRGLDHELSGAGARLIGGDTVRAPQWSLSLALVGVLPAGLPVAARHRAVPGQSLYLTGVTGRAGAGFLVLEHLDVAARRQYEALVAAHVSPQARLAEGRAIVESFPDAAMLDVSDGLARDSGRLARLSDVRLVVEKARLPVDPMVELVARRLGRQPEDLALSGGEDYELLFTTRAGEQEVRAAFDARGLGTRVTRIGRVEPGSGTWLEGESGTEEELIPGGFEHFT